MDRQTKNALEVAAEQRAEKLRHLRANSALLDSAESAALIGCKKRKFHYLKARDPSFPRSISEYGRPMYRRQDILDWVNGLTPVERPRVEPPQLAASHASIVHRIEPRATKSQKAARSAAGAGA